MDTRGEVRALGLAMMAWYSVAVAVLTGLILLYAPHFSYTLDDPYIHLALAQNIAHFHYGINAGETVSPASSVLWPFLLAPFSRIPVLNEWMPLVLNVVFSLGTCLVTGRFLEPRMRQAGFGTASIVGFAALLVAAANLPGLALTGMEHSLQVLLACLCAIAVLTAYEGGAIGMHLLIAAALAPAVRYEDVVFTGAVCGALWLQRRRKAAVSVFALSLLPLIALGLFLHSHGLSFFPNSVLAKGLGSVPSSSRWAPLLHLWDLAGMNLKLMGLKPERWPLGFSLLLLVYLTWQGRTRRRPAILFVAAAASLAMLLVGAYGWFYRYDMAVRYFLLLLAVGLLLDREVVHPRSRRVCAAWVLAVCSAISLWPPLLRTPSAAVEISRQQYQMHRLVHDFARETVAVNDLGWVSMDAYGRFYVLDLYGLANNEALGATVKDAAWLRQITAKHHAGLVMIYPSWFGGIPEEWPLLGVLRQRSTRFEGFAGTSVELYATSPESAAELRPKLEAFHKTLPDGVWFDPE